MDVLSFCPLRASGFTWQPSAGTFTQTVVVKGTFRLLPNESVLAEDQEAPSDIDNVPYKPKADVVLVGHAYAPGKQPARSWMTRLLVGEIDKSIEVWCDRVFRWQDGALLEGQRITKMPLVWERAAGGPETGNPVGMRFDAAPDRYGMVPIPNLQPPGLFVSSRADTFAPIGFGPISPEWPRTSGTYEKLAPGWRDRPFPQRFNYGYFQVAPPDQQVSEIRGNERIVLEKLHAEHARLVTSLPGMTPRAVLDRATGEREEVRLVADTLRIDTDRGICSVVWRGRVALRHVAEAGRIAVWMEGMPQVAPKRSAGNIEENDFTGTTVLTSFAKGDEPALPFVAGVSKLSESENREMVEGLSRWARQGSGNALETMLVPIARPSTNPLPFAGADNGVEDEADMVKTLRPMPKMDAMELPFVVPPLPAAPDIQAPVQIARETPGPLPPPPLMIGPLATAEMAAKNESKPVEVTTKEEPLPAPPLKADEPKKPGPEDFPLARCAALTASIARRKSEKARILEAEELTEREWEAIQKHWADAIKEETKRGKRAMLDRFDQAYVGQIEEERGPITVEEYAKLCVASERGTVDEVLTELGLPKGAVMRVERVWMGKLGKDSELATKLGESIEAKRSNPSG